MSRKAPMPKNINDVTFVRGLIESGVDINKKYGVNKETILHRAVYENYFDVVLYLVEAGADINRIDSEHFTPLLETGRSEIMKPVNIKMIEYLLDHGADREARTIAGTTIYTTYRVRQDDALVDHIKSYGLIPTKGVHLD